MNKSHKIVNRFFAEIDQLDNGKIKIRKAKQLINVNQYKRTWKRLDSRELAREINRHDLVIK